MRALEQPAEFEPEEPALLTTGLAEEEVRLQVRETERSGEESTLRGNHVTQGNVEL
jgi:hypothetical protein